MRPQPLTGPQSAVMAPAAALLALSEISVTLGGVTSVGRLSCDLHPGEVLGLVGQDRAGFSALVRCLSGVTMASSGQVLVNGRPVRIACPGDARALGIETIHQTLPLAENLDAVANLFLGRELVSPLGEADVATMAAETRKIMARLDPRFQGFTTPMSDLSGGQRRLVAIARAVYFGARVLILDTPTAGLGPQEIQMLAELIQVLKAQRLGIVLIEHDIHNLMKLCDRVVVMKNGQRVGMVKVGEVTDEDILGMIILGKKPAQAL
jgi:D-xylose transport system ATP-binding protein